ncbi:MAG: di-trans,poly-cis-decaprenylcistransferase [Synergistetes bacterium]|nr:di-trans,poly-cis-decaprenylcistransferase [Synergistota bacterium]
MDGNGRWAQRKGLPRIAGHREGVKAVERVISACLKRDIEYLSLYAFSTENWKRPESEIRGLMTILRLYFLVKLRKLKWAGVRIRVAGRWWELPYGVDRFIKLAMDETKNNTKMQVILHLNYGGRREILDAVNAMIGKEDLGEVTEDIFKSFLYIPDLPYPDLLIRTSGEKRISNFLLWQIAYTELYFTDTLWPDFGEDELDMAIADYNKRKRRFGGLG